MQSIVADSNALTLTVTGTWQVSAPLNDLGVWWAQIAFVLATFDQPVSVEQWYTLRRLAYAGGTDRAFHEAMQDLQTHK